LSAAKSALILGGGLAGLTCAHELAKAGCKVTVLEKLDVVGGLARNVTRGDGMFDLGGHRFFTAKPEMLVWLRELIGDELRQVGRKSRILLGGKFFDYPLRPVNAIFGFGLRRSANILWQYAGAALDRALSPQADLSFEDWVVARFGRALYDIYFKPYTEKVWGLRCEDISAEWAEQRIQLLNLPDAVWRAVRPGRESPKTYAQEFWYPAAGIGLIAETLARRVRELGGRVVTGCNVEHVAVVKNAVAEVAGGGKTYKASTVISTIPLTLLGRMFGAAPDALGNLSFRALRCVYLILNMTQVTDDSWLYFPEREILFGRSHEPRNWWPALAPKGRTSLCLEVFCNEGDRFWEMDEKELAAACAADLDRLGLVKREQVAGAFSEYAPHAYPVFRVGYRNSLREVLKHVGRIHNLHLVGRSGAYRYENMDQVAESAIMLARQLVQS